MPFTSSPELRAEVLTACRVLTHFRIAEGFGHVSARVAGRERILITPRRALGLVTEAELVELDPTAARSPARAAAARSARCISRSIAAAPTSRRWRAATRAMSRPMPAPAEPLKVAHGFGANLGARRAGVRQAVLVANAETRRGRCRALGDGEAVILQSNGMLAVGQSVPHACVQALFLEETARAAAHGRGGRLHAALLFRGGCRAPPRRRPRARAGARVGILRGGGVGTDQLVARMERSEDPGCRAGLIPDCASIRPRL